MNRYAAITLLLIAALFGLAYFSTLSNEPKSNLGRVESLERILKQDRLDNETKIPTH